MLTDDCLTVEVWDASDRVLAIVSADEFTTLLRHAPWRELMGDHEMTYCYDATCAAHCRAAMIELKQPRLQDQLYTYTPSKLTVQLSRLRGWLRWKLLALKWAFQD